MCRLILIPVLLLASLSSLSVGDTDGGDEPYEASDPEPSPEETLILEYINRFRADPTAEALRIAPFDRRNEAIGLDRVNRDVFRLKTTALEPSPPLVFDLSLVRAARRHSHYQILNGQYYYEEPDKPGFSGYDSTERTSAAGYRASRLLIRESFFEDAVDPWHAHAVDIIAYALDSKETGVPHELNACVINHEPLFKEFGCGYLPGRKLFSVSKIFAEGDGQRFSGGVAYIDDNHNGFYDIGEGRGGVIISSNGAIVESWKSGAYTLPIGKGAVTISAQMDEWRFTRSFDAGRDNVKFDILIPRKEDVKKAVKLLESIDHLEEDEENVVRFKVLLELYKKTRDLVLDEETRARIESLTSPAITSLKSAKEAVLEAFAAGDMREARKIIFSRKKDFSRTDFSDWFDDAERCSRQKEKYDQMAEFKVKGKKLSKKSLLRLADAMRKEARKLQTDEWRKWLGDLADRTVKLG